jgi:2-C-methyl-D-erythritol 4-phosphate cytidylyltransferase
MQTWAVVVAAGSGTRLGLDHPKAFVKLAGQPLLAHSVELFEDHPAVDRMVLVVPADWQEPTTLLADDLVAGKVVAAVAGGATRADSVAAGLAELPPVAEQVLVHDAARPLADAALIDRVLAGLGDADGCIPVLPVTDTVKQVESGQVVETLDRSRLVAVQTPQLFRTAALRQAYEHAGGDVSAATDCSSLVEAAGLRVVTVPGDPRNLKITDQSDLARAEGMLASAD